MKRYKITHQTIYAFSDPVSLLPHTLRLRPREGHELRIESSRLDIKPGAELLWHRDVEGNSVAIASFESKTKRLEIESEIVIQKYDLNPLNFLIASYAIDYPFNYDSDDSVSLSPYLNTVNADSGLAAWLHELWNPSEKVKTFTLLDRLNQRIYQTLKYRRREEEGVQPAEYTLACGSGSCRDFASLFMASAQHLGFAARFVSGYIYSGNNPITSGATHAWTEVFIPGAGWKGFDPTLGTIVGAEHIAVAVARRPELVPPVSGKFYGNPGSSMTVNVWVTEIY